MGTAASRRAQDSGEAGLRPPPATSTPGIAGRIRVFRPGEFSPIQGLDDPSAFDAVWALIEGRAEPGRDHAFLERWFLKGTGGREGGMLRRWRRAARTVREARSLLLMGTLGLPVPEVVAWGCERRWGLPSRAFLVESRIEGATRLGRWLREVSDRGRRREVLEAVGRAIALLHGRRWHHRDLSLRNILVRDAGGAPEVVLIDSPRATWGGTSLRRAFLRRADLLRLARGLRRCGVGREEAALALPGTAPGEAAAIHALAADRDRSRRFPPLPTLVWLWFGVLSRVSAGEPPAWGG